MVLTANNGGFTSIRTKVTAISYLKFPLRPVNGRFVLATCYFIQYVPPYENNESHFQLI